jgi:serine/threonine-protein kinase
VKVLDFGISKVLATTTRRRLLPTPRHVYGTVEYMSPQQLGGKPAAPADDLYALGCVLYESLSGRAPFEGDPDAVAARHAIETPEPIPPGPDRPRALCDLVTRLLSKSPSDRPASAAAVEGALTALLGSRPRV